MIAARPIDRSQQWLRIQPSRNLQDLLAPEQQLAGSAEHVAAWQMPATQVVTDPDQQPADTNLFV